MRTECPDCQGALEPIRLNDATHMNGFSGGGGSGHVDLSYSAVDSKRSCFMLAFKPKGTVDAMLCTSCGRILLYARPA